MLGGCRCIQKPLAPGRRGCCAPNYRIPRAEGKGSAEAAPAPVLPDAASAAAKEDDPQPQGTTPAVREYKAWGVRIVESNEPFPPGPEAEKDFWEGERFQKFGEAIETYFLPGLLVLGIICGVYAANTYNEGATEYVRPATGPDSPATVIPSSALEAPPPAAASTAAPPVPTE